jgi:hypothetical protein
MGIFRLLMLDGGKKCIPMYDIGCIPMYDIGHLTSHLPSGIGGFVPSVFLIIFTKDI